ncbi:hypothetical protein MCOR02_000920 [Pyricularia oryzae]|uniref:Protein kinase domain-containing protein n=1 Tax=Pyricularia grisea TaxID=148305 RepID=A0ABQ8NTB6_PYRGI|nr:hypothetical protein MCOR01_009473 [Pyricularia oryzae]KAI6301581.1 hypothetical protein MCOR33_002977 [Pyricularia grisea]KAH9437265.1 hypothetical protein MCOR02_000920 [Pyricularia oryzae]KAI6258450.1 hypothetical protein MCOR19_005180 [Pyricularia oryzae]KAI6268782.1 hypothetical protein MCOR26_009024 [Pyricularia oryzae]
MALQRHGRARKIAKESRVIAHICVNDNHQHDLSLAPENYRPPEVVTLDMLWSYPVDMWCLGITVWRMLDTKSFFSHYAGEDLDEARHLSLMVGLLGPPPREFLQNSKGSLKYWDENGKWNGLVASPPPSFTLESIWPLKGESRTLSLDFIRKVLCWDREIRLYPGEA